jgi:hypothetical protein
MSIDDRSWGAKLKVAPDIIWLIVWQRRGVGRPCPAFVVSEYLPLRLRA